ncbi:hypothetical protein Zmor_024825 [Zophobas morio]|uniref:NADPH--hemoprotein reductase n=1 Tax=Zophobas morio TaxID=2755281 RepID=A0AA38HJT6_9CUCU|nr:hypothetical protein Zmor_024825 [Zophobas morio]
MICFYGSQTGTAEGFASRLSAEASAYGFNALTADLEDYNCFDFESELLEDKLVVFFIATYGDGDPTENALSFFEYIKEQVSEESPKYLRYAVFSLGNSTYEHYQAAGRYVDHRLEELGCIRQFIRGEGDDEGIIENDFTAWKNKFWLTVCKKYGKEVPENFSQIDILYSSQTSAELAAYLWIFLRSRKYRLEVHHEVVGLPVNTGRLAKLDSGGYSHRATLKAPMDVPVILNKELFTGSARSCRHVVLDIADINISYQAGDHVGIYPCNDWLMVERLGRALRVDLDTVVSFHSLDAFNSKEIFPNPCSYRTAFRHFVDINGGPTPHHLRVFAEYAEGNDRERLLFLSSEAGKEDYEKFVVADMRCFAEVLEYFPSLQPSVDHFIELLPRLHCRYYSISSSPKQHAHHIHVTASVVSYKSPLGRTIKGVCSSYLSSLTPGQSAEPPRVPIFVRSSSFKLPRDRSADVIMIGPGTGLAPFRGFLQDRHYHLRKGECVGDTVLYYGCRTSNHEFLYKEEIMHYYKEKVITKLYLAFSRDQEEKVYVTHLLKKNSKELMKYMENGAYIFICGDGKRMAKDVHQVICSVVQERKVFNEKETVEYVQKLQREGRILQDVW